MEISRYVYQKYIKRKYVTELNQPDPLTAYKNNNYTLVREEKEIKETEARVQNKKIEVMSQTEKSKGKGNLTNKKVENLIDFDYVSENEHQNPTQSEKNELFEAPSSTENNYSGRYSVVGTSFTTQTPKDDFITFDQLMKSQKNQENTLHHSNSTQQFTKTSLLSVNNYCHPYNPNLAQQNLVYNSYFHPNSAHHYHLNSPHSHSPQPHTNHINSLHPYQNYISVNHFPAPSASPNTLNCG